MADFEHFHEKKYPLNNVPYERKGGNDPDNAVYPEHKGNNDPSNAVYPKHKRDNIPLNPGDKVMTLAEAVAWREAMRRAGRKVAVTNGCFDILHRGHVQYLFDARKTADALLVLINADASVRELKGPTRPINEESARAFVLAGLAAVDAVVIFDGVRCTKELRAIQPDIYAKGGDYTMETLNPEERGALLETGAEFRLIPFVEGFSTTKTIEKMR